MPRPRSTSTEESECEHDRAKIPGMQDSVLASGVVAPLATRALQHQVGALTAAQPDLRMGIDIGSVTAKVVVLGPTGRDDLLGLSPSPGGNLGDPLLRYSRKRPTSLGDVPVNPMITGSAGMGVSERYGIPFIQEMIASAEVVKRLYPQVRTLIDIGGEDAKLIYFDRDGIPDMRMNGTCAGGTGAYIDEMAALLNVPVGDLGALAGRSDPGLPDGLPLRCVREDGRPESAQPRGAPTRTLPLRSCTRWSCRPWQPWRAASSRNP